MVFKKILGAIAYGLTIGAAALAIGCGSGDKGFECYQESQCKTEETCIDGYCQPKDGCTTDEDCGERVCDLESGKCVYALEDIIVESDVNVDSRVDDVDYKDSQDLTEDNKLEDLGTNLDVKINQQDYQDNKTLDQISDISPDVKTDLEQEIEECIPDCYDKECGNDGCGDNCGDCGPSNSCKSGTCYGPGKEFDPCNNHTDCLTGICAEGPKYDFCTKMCSDYCSEGLECQSVPDLENNWGCLMPSTEFVGWPCDSDEDCGDQYSAATCAGETCTVICSPQLGCPEGLHCVYEPMFNFSNVCLPDN
jgi:hypothetical protein